MRISKDRELLVEIGDRVGYYGLRYSVIESKGDYFDVTSGSDRIRFKRKDFYYDFKDEVWRHSELHVSTGENVVHPNHYTGTYGIECIEAIKNALTPAEFRGYCRGNIMKYVWREGDKNGDEDLKKIKMYADFALEASDDK